MRVRSLSFLFSNVRCTPTSYKSAYRGAPLSPCTCPVYHVRGAPLSLRTCPVNHVRGAPLSPCTCPVDHVRSAPLSPRTCPVYHVRSAPLSPRTCPVYHVRGAPLSPRTCPVYQVRECTLHTSWNDGNETCLGNVGRDQPKYMHSRTLLLHHTDYTAHCRHSCVRTSG